VRSIRFVSSRVAIAMAVAGLSVAPGGLAGHDGGAARGAVPRGPSKGPVADFNGDGYADLAVGVPGEAVGRIGDAGAVNVIYGSADGLSAAGNQLWTLDSPGIVGSAALADEFGFAVATGDLNGDGFSDLAIGIPGKNSPVEDAGAVEVMYGSANGLTANGNQFWTQSSPGILGTEQVADGFGRSLAIGDFNDDGFADLAVGVPFDNVDGKRHPGAVNVIYGSANGLTAAGNQLWNQDSPDVVGSAHAGDLFGFSLAGGDFNHDGFGDLAVGAPGEGPPQSAGAVTVLPGSAGGLTATGNQSWTQNTPGVIDVSEAFDLFGYSLAAGDFDGNGFDDLAVGVPFEDVGSVPDAGAVNVLYGSANGLTAAGNQLWSQAGPILNYPQTSDEFGFSVVAGDFNGDGKADLVAGVPGENVGTHPDAGAVNVIYGSAKGLASAGNQFWSQDSPGIIDICERGDRFGFALVARNFGKGAEADLAVGVPFEDIGRIEDAGGMNVIYGSPKGLTAAGNQFWSQASPGIIDLAEPGDEFGYAAGR
jgi:FG-GAP repeat